MQNELRAHKAKIILSEYYDKITPRAQKVFTDIVNGSSYLDISMDLACTEHAVRKLVANQFKRFNLQDLKIDEPTPPRKGRKVPLAVLKKLADREDVRILHSDGLTNEEIMKRVGISKTTLTTHFQSLGLKANRKQSPLGWLTVQEAKRAIRHANIRSIERLRAKGFTHLEDMASYRNISYSQMRKIVNSTGLTVPSRKGF